MSVNILDTSIEYLKGVGPKRAEVLKKELGVFTFNDLMMIFPFRYVDKSKFYLVKEIREGLPYVQLKGKITNVKSIGKSRNTRLTARFSDSTGSITLVWFKGIKWYINKFNPNTEYIVYGQASIFNREFNIIHPEVEEVSEAHQDISGMLQAVYNSTEKLKSLGLDSRGILRLMKTLVSISAGSLPENIPGYILEKLALMSREEALINIHFPSDAHKLQKAQARLKFEELFFMQLQLIKYKTIRTQKITGLKFIKVGEYLNNFYHKKLPFELTSAQKKVIKEIRADVGSGKQMNRLLQGDVGSGKTMVAVMTMLIALDNGYQSCLMAPTEILAAQHYLTISKMLNGLDVEVELLTGSTKVSERKAIHEKLETGKLQILIGTHALIEESVKFKNLGFVVIDEQHRFGVAQRAKLWTKNETPPHVLVMTATPIPRTLAMTVYGDLDTSVIDELPPGRKTIKTYHFYDKDRLKVFGFIRKQIEKGQQIYIVFPLINESQKLDMKYLMDGYESIVREFPLPEYAVSIVHGQMKSADKEFEMQRFLKKQTQIMVATTVIEVGVDVQNASVMIIENAERFGLSQLHQLRGRVGRGYDQSYCLLMTGFKLTTEAKKRIETMVKTNDGFEIAEVDLKLRGPGDLQGTQQSGILDLKIADIIKDEKILKYSRNLASEIIKEDPELKEIKNIRLAHQLKIYNKTRKNWGQIS